MTFSKLPHSQRPYLFTRPQVTPYRESETLDPERVFDEHHRSVYRFLYRLTGRGDLAEDITQECFLAVLHHPGRWDAARGSIRTYLFSIARNLASKHYRACHDEVPSDPEELFSIPDVRSDQELAVVVAQAVSQLPDLQREALLLFEYEGFALVEIAEIVGADTGTVKSRLHRARGRLRRVLAPHRKAATHENV